jgi:SHS family lactate transporter-like MFS transporter
MLRSVGAIVFGIAADRYGRKWPFIINNVLFIVLELATGFTSRYDSFLACRALFGIAMGGLYGNIVATALEDCPPDARGILSGLLQAGYPCGYLFATVFARALVGTTRYGWRPLYWFGACPPVLIILFRLCLPETKSYREGEGVRRMTSTKALLREGKLAIQNHWLLLIYLVLLLAGINFTVREIQIHLLLLLLLSPIDFSSQFLFLTQAHGTQDLYPTLLQNQFQFSHNEVTVTQVAANLGAMTGGVLVGYLSEIFGRRISMITMCLLAAPVLYPYSVFISTKGGVIAAAFFEQFCVQGAFGVIPGHLAELAPSSFRTLVVGTAYQLGNLASSASSTIEAKIGEGLSVPMGSNGTKRYDYGTVIGIFVACSLAFVIIMVFLGPEKKGVRLDGNTADVEPEDKQEETV